MFFLMLSCGISTTVLQIRISLQLFIHRKVPIDLLEKGYLNFRKHLPIWCFEKIIAPKFLHTSQQNIQGGILFKCACRPS